MSSSLEFEAIHLPQKSANSAVSPLNGCTFTLPVHRLSRPSDGYTNATNNRQVFPISNGYILWRGPSTNWSAAVTIGFGANPNSPDSFTNGTTERFVVPPFTGKDTSGCIAVNVSSLISPEIRIGADATLQLVQDTGGQRLYQVRRLPECVKDVANLAISASTYGLGMEIIYLKA